MENNTQIKLGEDDVAEAILGRYAMWHPEIEERELCSPCQHCSGGEDCHPCSAPEPK
ncbi:MAG: hypothetical protein ABIC36_01015 [bacterium]